MTREEAIEEIRYYCADSEEIIKALEQEPTTNNDLGVDCISRIETIDYLCKHCPDDGECFKDCDEIKHLRQMPSVTPQEPTDKNFTKADIDAIVKAINAGWELRVNEILDKIRAEIETKYGQCDICEYDSDYCGWNQVGDIADILQIIDKYKAESEE